MASISETRESQSPRPFDVAPLIPGFGVEISGVDVTTADAPTLNEIVYLLEHKGVLVLRDQSLSPEAQLAFTSLLGVPAGNPTPEFSVPGYPDVFVISNKIVDGKPIGDAEAGTAWHTDLNYEERPAAYTVLHALEVPPEGSDTQIADTCAAWNALPPERQAAIDGLRVEHSYENLAARSNRTLSDEERALYPPVRHPLVRRHPADGRKTLWGMSTTTPNGIVGIDNPAGKDLIRDVMEFAIQDHFVYTHKWRVGDVLVWDNRCTMHRGTSFDTKAFTRHVHRTWVRGEVPV
ncbi:MAG: TauD/TfdA family dioxygenase [Hyphomicrobiales bacterium]|nr:TauD/TfdA family dioxygenase [Hyphomicrobiales bacterium]